MLSREAPSNIDTQPSDIVKRVSINGSSTVDILPFSLTTGNYHGLHLIIFWSTYFGTKHFGFGLGRDHFIKNKCKFTNCITSTDKTLYDKSDVIIMHINEGPVPLPTYRLPHQRWIGFLLESGMGGTFKRYNGPEKLNWTATFRADSDVYMPYFILEKLEHKTDITGINFAAGKTALICWVNSNCHTTSQRERYVTQLQKYISVDQFGGCNGKPCPKPHCFENLGKKYKFYISFENALCKDYMTEKVSNAFSNDMVPIVLGQSNYSQFLPKGSYIDVRSFSSANDLAIYLKLLNSNSTLYNEYFQWRVEYSKPIGGIPSGFCKLCAKLNQPIEKKTYEDVESWWNGTKICKHPNDFYKNIL